LAFLSFTSLQLIENQFFMKNTEGGIFRKKQPKI
jgi:hypothetical protein